MHKLLERQLRRAGVSADAWCDGCQQLLALVDEAYTEADKDRALMDRSLELTSQELLGRQQQLQSELDARLQTESALRASEERYRVLFQASPLNILVFAVDTWRIVECNSAAVAFYGYSRDELLGIRFTDLNAKPDDPELRAVPQAWRDIKTHRRKDGTLVDVSITGHAAILDGQKVVLAMGVDVTETRRLEERLRQSQKMEAVGLLAGGIAHDFNNIIAAVLVSADLAVEALDAGHPAAQDLQEIAKAGKRAATLTQQLLAFSRKQPSQPRVVTLSAVVSGMDKMLRRVLGEDVELSTALAPVPWSVRADPGHLEQVLLNLAVNARDAMPKGGKLTITIRNDTLDRARAAELDMPPGQVVALSVIDTGCGMDAATRARIFDPFFTTKEVGKGTGLGLATVFGLVKQSGGSIWVRSEPGRGSEFVVYFPRARAAADSRPSQRPVVVGEMGSETVLVVEDDLQVQGLVCRVLAARGYRVLRADGPQQALALLKGTDETVSLLLTDIVMPQLDGRALASRAIELRPDLRVVFMSGYTEHAAVSRVSFGPDEYLIRKPFTSQELARGVRLALDGNPGSPAAP
jgi:two-component system cell cycle sensor histidine kinase/response regulator CckA